MLRHMLAATAAVALLAGCGGGNESESTSDASPQDTATTAATPTEPSLAQYDPPKAFSDPIDFPQTPDRKSPTFVPKAGMVGRTAIIATMNGITAYDVADPNKGFAIFSRDTTVQNLDVTAPKTVQVDGKELAAVAYYQRVQGTGTSKPKVQVLFQWIDPEQQKAVTELKIDVTPVIGEDEVNTMLPGGFTTEIADADSGEMAVGLAPTGLIGAKSGIFTVYADPATKKTSTVRFVEPAGVSNGIVVGAKGSNNTRLTLVVVDALTGAVKKSLADRALWGLKPAGYGAKHAYLYGQRYVNNRYQGIFFAVDPVTATITQTPSAIPQPQYLTRYDCWGDGRSAVVCTERHRFGEIIAFDDTTGKKTWGYTEVSGGRVVPKITAAYHGLIYAQVESGPVLMDAATGQDVPTPTPTPTTPTATPAETTAAPIDEESPATGSSEGVDELKSPAAVSPFGGVYVTDGMGNENDKVVVMRAAA